MKSNETFVQSFPISWNVWIYESCNNDERGPVNLMRPFWEGMVKFLEEIRVRPFKCLINCLDTPGDNVYIYHESADLSVINLQNIRDPCLLVRIISHELCHYIMDNHRKWPNPVPRRKLSSFEEVFAEMFSFLQLKSFQQWSHQNEPLWTFVDPFVESQFHQHEPLIQQMLQQGFEALPLFEEGFLPHYDNIAAIALFLLPYFEQNPELWKILPHVQDVDPRSSWHHFFDHLMMSADPSYQDSLGKLKQRLFS